jgi:hypothetical protein
MKHYETTFEEYNNALNEYNLHPELEEIFKSTKNKNIGNSIFYGPPGSGKYSQVLSMLTHHSPSSLKYQRKMTATTDKTEYIYPISDIHYEVDMALLGCNSKTIWHEIFLQIVDIVYTKSDKHGYIVCKNFHSIHTELLDIFYSYMQEFTSEHSHITLNFIIVTEHLSFIPNNIQQSSRIINIRKPTKSECLKIIKSEPVNALQGSKHCSNVDIIKNLNVNTINNLKLLKSISNNGVCKMPPDTMSLVCDKIIKQMKDHKNISYIDLRENIYELLTYNTDITKSIWYIITHFIRNQTIEHENMNNIMDKTFTSLKYYNNNYRPIYHIESILLYITAKLFDYEC